MILALIVLATSPGPSEADAGAAPLSAPPMVPADAVDDLGPANEIRGDLGIFAPTGFAGVLYNRRLVPHLQLEGGVGLGLTGVQVSLMPKLTFGSREDVVYTGVGVAWAFQGSQTDVWLNWDIIGYEHRFGGGFVINLGVGWFWGLSGTYEPFSLCITEDCSAPAPRSLVGYNLPQGHLGFGYAF